MRLDRLSLHIARLAVQTEIDKVAVLIDTVINGDGNSNGATNHNLTALDTGTTANNMTLKAWISFKMQFAPYTMQAVIAQEGPALTLLTLDTGSANNLATETPYTGFRPLNPSVDNRVGIGWTSDAPANKYVGIDTGLAVERLFEIGADIEEIENFIVNQTKVIVFTEVEGFAIFDQYASRTLDLTA